MTVGIGRGSWRRLRADRTRTGIAIDARMAPKAVVAVFITGSTPRAVVAVFIAGSTRALTTRAIPSSVGCMWRRSQNFSVKQLTDRRFSQTRQMSDNGMARPCSCPRWRKPCGSSNAKEHVPCPCGGGGWWLGFAPLWGLLAGDWGPSRAPSIDLDQRRPHSRLLPFQVIGELPQPTAC